MSLKLDFRRYTVYKNGYLYFGSVWHPYSFMLGISIFHRTYVVILTTHMTFSIIYSWFYCILPVFSHIYIIFFLKENSSNVFSLRSHIWPPPVAIFSPFGYGKLLELVSISNYLNNSEGMTIMRKEWHRVFFWKKIFFGSNLSPFRFIPSVRS